jgi:hypothetical protein
VKEFEFSHEAVVDRALRRGTRPLQEAVATLFSEPTAWSWRVSGLIEVSGRPSPKIGGLVGPSPSTISLLGADLRDWDERTRSHAVSMTGVQFSRFVDDVGLIDSGTFEAMQGDLYARVELFDSSEWTVLTNAPEVAAGAVAFT